MQMLAALDNNEEVDVLVTFQVTDADVAAAEAALAASPQLPSSTSTTSSGTTTAAAARAGVATAPVADGANADGQQVVIGDDLARQARLRAQADVKDLVLSRSTSARAASAAAAPDASVSMTLDFPQLPVSLVRLGSREAYEALRGHGSVLSVEPNRR